MKLIDGRYKIQGLDVLTLCRRFGTPLYVYDASKIAMQIATLKQGLSNCHVKIRYAVKALSNFSVLKHICHQGCGADVVSIYEARLALRAGFDPKSIIFTPNCVSFDEIAEGAERGLVVNLDNLSAVEKFGRLYGSTYPCSIRFNPGILAGGNQKIATGHAGAKFGIALAQMPQLVKLVARYNIPVEGLHIHVGSEISDTNTFLKIAQLLLNTAGAFPGVCFIDLGSGFKVSNGRDSKGTDVHYLGVELEKLLVDFSKQCGRKLELWVEPGKYLVSEAGHLFVTVNVVKKNPSVTFVGVNSGLNHFLRPMMYDAYHDILNVTDPMAKRRLYTVVGHICETDTFGENRSIAEVREGDVLSIENAGAYGYSMASNFNFRPRPAEVMIQDAKPILVRREDVFEDLLRGQIGID